MVELMLVEDASFDPTCTSRPQKVIPTFFPATPTFYEKDRIKAKKQISRQELFRKILFLNLQQYFQLCTKILVIN
jgi:long-subunit acyl-CoA synthetase (AMP-forming)